MVVGSSHVAVTYILMYSTHYEDKSVIAEMFVKTLKSVNADYSASTENIESNLKAPS